MADPINESGHSLMKSTNRWYAASAANNRPEAMKSWDEAKTRMEQSAELLRTKVNAAISDMWHRYTRLTEIEARVREGKEPI